MPARDLYHDTVVHALQKDGWTITNDPLRIVIGGRDSYVDLGAERIIAAERNTEKIAVEIKTFGGSSQITELHRALGQFVFYQTFLNRDEPDRKLFLAVPDDAAQDIFQDEAGRVLLEEKVLRILVFDTVTETIIEWKL